MDSESQKKEVETNDSNESIKPYSGYMISCGHCFNHIVYPINSKRIQCPVCHSLNTINNETIPLHIDRGTTYCPMCKRHIVSRGNMHHPQIYTLGSTHYRCSCGSIIGLSEPIYYIPYYKH